MGKLTRQDLENFDNFQQSFSNQQQQSAEEEGIRQYALQEYSMPRRALTRSGYETLGTFSGLAGLVGKAIPDALGGRALTEAGLRGYEALDREASFYPATVSSYKDVTADITKAPTFIIEKLFEAVPSMATAVFGSVAGSFLGKPLVQKASKSLLKNQVEKATNRELAKYMVRKKIGKEVSKAELKKVKDTIQQTVYKNIAAKGGMVATVSGMESGGMFGETKGEGALTAATFGTAAGFLELLGGNIAFIDKFLPAGKINNLVDAVKTGKGAVVKRYVKEILKNAGEEGVQEAGQEFLSVLHTVANTDTKLLTPQTFDRIAESFFAGAVPGAAFGVVKGRYAGEAEIKPTESDLDLAKQAMMEADDVVNQDRKANADRLTQEKVNIDDEKNEKAINDLNKGGDLKNVLDEYYEGMKRSKRVEAYPGQDNNQLENILSDYQKGIIETSPRKVAEDQAKAEAQKKEIQKTAQRWSKTTNLSEESLARQEEELKPLLKHKNLKDQIEIAGDWIENANKIIQAQELTEAQKQKEIAKNVQTLNKAWIDDYAASVAIDKIEARETKKDYIKANPNAYTMIALLDAMDKQIERVKNPKTAMDKILAGKMTKDIEAIDKEVKRKQDVKEAQEKLIPPIEDTYDKWSEVTGTTELRIGFPPTKDKTKEIANIKKKMEAVKLRIERRKNIVKNKQEMDALQERLDTIESLRQAEFKAPTAPKPMAKVTQTSKKLFEMPKDIKADKVELKPEIKPESKIKAKPQAPISTWISDTKLKTPPANIYGTKAGRPFGSKTNKPTAAMKKRLAELETQNPDMSYKTVFQNGKGYIAESKVESKSELKLEPKVKQSASKQTKSNQTPDTFFKTSDSTKKMVKRMAQMEAIKINKNLIESIYPEAEIFRITPDKFHLKMPNGTKLILELNTNLIDRYGKDSIEATASGVYKRRNGKLATIEFDPEAGIISAHHEHAHFAFEFAVTPEHQRRLLKIFRKKDYRATFENLVEAYEYYIATGKIKPVKSPAMVKDTFAKMKAFIESFYYSIKRFLNKQTKLDEQFIKGVFADIRSNKIWENTINTEFRKIDGNLYKIKDTIPELNLNSMQEERHDVSARSLWDQDWKTKFKMLKESWRQLGRPFKHLPKEKWGRLNNTLRILREVPVNAGNSSAYNLLEITKDIVNKNNGRDKRVFELKLLYEDMVKDLEGENSTLTEPTIEDLEIARERYEQGKSTEGYTLPFGFESKQEIIDKLAILDKIIAEDTSGAIQKAIDDRYEFMNALKHDLVAEGILPYEALSEDRYFHHQVLMYRGMQTQDEKNYYIGQGVSQGDIKFRKKGWEARRKGSRADYNQEYFTSEFEVVSQAVSKLAHNRGLQKIGEDYNISADLLSFVKAENESATLKIDKKAFDAANQKMAISALNVAKYANNGMLDYIEDENVKYIVDSLSEQYDEYLNSKKKNAKDSASWKYPEHPEFFTLLNAISVAKSDIYQKKVRAIIKQKRDGTLTQEEVDKKLTAMAQPFGDLFAVRGFFSGLGDKTKAMRDTLGNKEMKLSDAVKALNEFIKDYNSLTTDKEKDALMLRDNIPQSWKNYTSYEKGVAEFNPDAANRFFLTNSIPDTILDMMELTGDVPTEVKQVWAKGKPTTWVMPLEVSMTLNDFRDFEPKHPVTKVIHATTTGLKKWLLTNPHKMIKYNFSNFTGDMDIILAYDYRMLKYMKKAAGDLWKEFKQKPYESFEVQNQLANLRKTGLLASGWSAAEVTDFLNTMSEQQFIDMITSENTKTLATIPMKAWKNVQAFTTWRENILRLAAYRFFEEQIETDATKIVGINFNGASRSKELLDLIDPGGKSGYADMTHEDRVKYLNGVEVKNKDGKMVTGEPSGIYKDLTLLDEVAAKLARELMGDYGNVTYAGQWLRSNLIPFYSWLEINNSRYLQLLKNLPKEGKSIKWLSLSMAGRASVFALKVNILYGAIKMWNSLMFPDEDDEIGEGKRKQLHIILGRTPTGDIISARASGAMRDVLETLGATHEDIWDSIEGRVDLKEKLTDSALAPFERFFLGINPLYMLPFNMLSKQTLFPEPFKPRAIRDRGEFVANLVSLGTYYRYFRGIPTTGDSTQDKIFHDLLSAGVYFTKSGEAAYFDIKSKTYDFMKKIGKEAPSLKPTSKQNALYYYKQALRHGDVILAHKHLSKYKELGGNLSSLKTSIKLAHPIANLPKKYRSRFMKTLNPKEKITYKRALKWYNETYR